MDHRFGLVFLWGTHRAREVWLPRDHLYRDAIRISQRRFHAHPARRPPSCRRTQDFAAWFSEHGGAALGWGSSTFVERFSSAASARAGPRYLVRVVAIPRSGDWSLSGMVRPQSSGLAPAIPPRRIFRLRPEWRSALTARIVATRGPARGLLRRFRRTG